MKYKPINVEKLRKDFCLVDGVLFKNKGDTKNPAKLYTDKKGYLSVSWSGSKYQAHRLIWSLHHGKDLQHQIDHIDGNTSNNAIDNLRDVTPRVNCGNKRIHREGKLTGAGKQHGRGYPVSIRILGSCISIGVYFTELEAHEAYKKATELEEFFDGDHTNFRDLVKSHLDFSSTDREVLGYRRSEETGSLETYIHIGNTFVYLGQYSSVEEAKAIREKAREISDMLQTPEQFRRLLQNTLGISEKSVKYKGVTKEKRNNTWIVRIARKGVSCSLGAYRDLSVAESVYEMAYLMRDSLIDPKEFKTAVLSKLGIIEEEPKGYTKLPSGRYHVVIGVNKSRVVLGTFDTKERAQEVYQKAVEHRDNFTNKEDFKKLVLSA